MIGLVQIGVLGPPILGMVGRRLVVVTIAVAVLLSLDFHHSLAEVLEILRTLLVQNARFVQVIKARPFPT